MKYRREIVEPDEVLSPYGMRSLSRFHEEHPFAFGGASVGYEPAEATTILKGGNSNWRRPMWFPTTFLMIETLRKLEKAFGSHVRVQVDEDVAREDDGAYFRATEGIGGGATHGHTRGIQLAPAAAPSAQTMGLAGLTRMLAERMICTFLPDAEGYRPVLRPARHAKVRAVRTRPALARPGPLSRILQRRHRRRPRRLTSDGVDGASCEPDR